MKIREFQREAKILLTELDAGRNMEENLVRYGQMLASALSSYSMIRVLLNFYTRWEISREDPDASGYDAEELNSIRQLFTMGTTGSQEEDVADPEAVMEKVCALREPNIRRMTALTRFTDRLAIYEHILNRKVPEEDSLDHPVDIEELAASVEKFIFSDQDTMVTNTRLQRVVAELPVRMTKQRFYDVLSETLNLYKGGELSAADDFISSIRDVAGISEAASEGDMIPEGFHALEDELRGLDLKNSSEAKLRAVNDRLVAAGEELGIRSTGYIGLQEIQNDLMILYLMRELRSEEFLDDRFESARTAFEKLLTFAGQPAEEDADALMDEFTLQVFPLLEGAQEEIYEALLIPETRLDSLKKSLPASVKKQLVFADLLTSDSVFVEPEKLLRLEEKERIMADEAAIEERKEKLIETFDGYFDGIGAKPEKKMEKEKRRAIMAAVLGFLPPFFNTRDEIREYIRYTLNNCSDPVELAAVRDILMMVME